MSWTFDHSNGQMFRPNGNLFHTGYSGNDWAANQPVLQHIRNLGPIPSGRWRMELITNAAGQPISHNGLAAPVIRLLPEPGTQVYGRDGFLIHGDNAAGDNTASTGCIVINGAALRQEIWNSGDRILEVVP